MMALKYGFILRERLSFILLGSFYCESISIVYLKKKFKDPGNFAQS